MPKAKKGSKSKTKKCKRGGGDKKPLMPIKQQTGGVVLPSEYFGGNSGRYFPAGSSELKSCAGQFPVSRGVVHADGKWAGPMLKPQHAGGKRKLKTKKMNKRKKTKKTNRKLKKTKKNKKNKKNVKH